MKDYRVQEDVFMRYQDFEGEETPILFIHGLGCAGSFDYPEVADHGKLKNHRCILVDLLGAGYSDKPIAFDYQVNSHAEYLNNFVEELGLKKFIIYGHSLGGAIAIKLASICKEAAQLILNESNLDPSAKGSCSYEIAAYSEEDFINNGFIETVNRSKENKNAMWAATFSNWLPAAAYKLSKNAVSGGTPSWRDTLYKLPIPKSFIFGEYSLPDKDYEVLQKHGLHIEIVQKAGHSMAWENPNGLALAIGKCVSAHK